MGRNATPTATATTAMIQVARRTWRSSGLGSVRTRWDRVAIRPSSVCMPVRVTTVLASPPVQLVPLKTRFSASSREPGTAGRAGCSADRLAGSDSPVNADRSSSIVPSMIRASAQTRSPSAITSTSPGTRSRAAISRRTPSRTTRAVAGRKAANASTARSACISWTKANPALSKITATTATARAGVPPAQASPAASASRTASGWVNWAARQATAVRCGGSARSGRPRPGAGRLPARTAPRPRSADPGVGPRAGGASRPHRRPRTCHRSPDGWPPGQGPSSRRAGRDVADVGQRGHGQPLEGAGRASATGDLSDIGEFTRRRPASAVSRRGRLGQAGSALPASAQALQGPARLRRTSGSRGLSGPPKAAKRPKVTVRIRQ